MTSTGSGDLSTVRPVGQGSDIRRCPAGRWVLIALVLLAVVPRKTSAQAEGFTLDQYRPAETPLDGFALSRPDDLGHLGLGFQVHVDYAYRPLVANVETATGGTEVVPIVAHQMVGTVTAAVGLFERLVLFGGLPASLLMRGEGQQAELAQLAPDGPTLGDAFFGGRFRLAGVSADFFSLALQASLTLPTARAASLDQRYGGERNFAGLVDILGEIRPGPVRITLNIGAFLRQRTAVGATLAGHQLTWGLAVSYRVARPVELVAETYGSTSLTSRSTGRLNPVEAIGGIRLYPGAGFVVGLAGGAGFTSALGSPAARAVLSLGWAWERNRIRDTDDTDASPDECAPSGDHHTSSTRASGCPDGTDDSGSHEPPSAAADGSSTTIDGENPWDVAGHECSAEPPRRAPPSACPDADFDGDGVVNRNDACPTEEEDLDGRDDNDGCPDDDNDGDGIPDGDDQCPNEMEDRDEFQDGDGCPDEDNDGDGFADSADSCPLGPGREEEGGCPSMIRLTPDGIQLLRPLQFERDQFALRPGAAPILKEIVELLSVNPQIGELRIEGHTDARGGEDHNLRLSRQRAEAVRDALIRGGVAADRLIAEGNGENRPVASNSTPRGRAANRRVELHLIRDENGENTEESAGPLVGDDVNRTPSQPPHE